jgi:hypothetical protein
LAGFASALIISILFLFIIRIRYLLRLIVWVCITTVFLILTGGSYFLYQRAKSHSEVLSIYYTINLLYYQSIILSIYYTINLFLISER